VNFISLFPCSPSLRNRGSKEALRPRAFVRAVAAACLAMSVAAPASVKAAGDGGPEIWMVNPADAAPENKPPAPTGRAQAKAGARTDTDQEAVERRSREAQQQKIFGAQNATSVQKGGWGGAQMRPFGSSTTQNPSQGVDAGERVPNPNAPLNADADTQKALSINAQAAAQATLEAAREQTTYPAPRGATISPQQQYSLPPAQQAPQAQQAQQAAQPLPMLPPLPQGGAFAGIVNNPYVAAQPLPSTSSTGASPQQTPPPLSQPSLSLDQAPVANGHEFERLDLNARAARLVPLSVGANDKQKVEARVYQESKGALFLAFREELQLLPNDPARIDRLKKAPYAKTELNSAKSSDYSHRITAASTSDMVQTGVQAGFLWRPALGGAWVEAAFHASALAGFDEIDAPGGHERTPRLAQRSALIDFDVSQTNKPQMAWLPAEGADTLSGEDAGRSVYWLLVVGSPDSFKNFDPKKAIVDARSGSL